MKIVVNRCYGGFSVSDEVLYRLGITPNDDKWPILSNEDFGIESKNSYAYRAHPKFVKIVEELGPQANGYCSKLEVVEIPDDVNWTIEDYDGYETIVEVHRKW